MKFLALVVALSLVSFNASAKMGYFKKFKAQYPNTTILGESCTICHTNQDDYAVNAYGQDLSNNGLNFTAIEGFDSDVDGVTNIAEITAGTLPGNADSK